MDSLFLSHFLDFETPGFGGANDFNVSPRSAIKNGKSSNSLNLKLSNHIGTHVDCPYHFDDEGQKLSDYPSGFWRFNFPQLIDLTVTNDQLINLVDLECHIVPETDLLLLRTGFEKYRQQKIYWEHNPGLLPESGFFLREKFPSIRCIGFDFISLTAFQHREAGRAAHRAFLGPHKKCPPILIVEDMKLTNWKTQFSKVLISPLMIAGADGAPVTVIGY